MQNHKRKKFTRKKKSAEQKKWEIRKLKMAGISVEDVPSDDTELYSLKYKNDSLFRMKTVSPESIFDFKNEMFLIGNRENTFHKQFPQKEFVYQKSSIERKGNFVFDFKSLPVYKSRFQFLDLYDINDILILTGETGCGKSTIVPRLIYDKYKPKICVTQPRRVAVKALYDHLALIYKSEIGYALKHDQNVTEHTRIKIVTEGILLKEMQTDSLLLKYDVIICDEIHERSLNIDIIFGLLKILKIKRKSLKIVLMSATVQIDVFRKFFDCPHFSFDGIRYPVEMKYLPVNVDDYIEWISKKVIYINETQEQGDILVFLTGKQDIKQVYSILSSMIYINKMDIIPLYSEILNEVYDHIFYSKTDIRRCILSTNIAEASVTIPNIRYVVDSGLQKISFFDYQTGTRLIKYPISKDSAVQRAGRAGRQNPGVCFRMYTEETYHSLQDTSIPDILRSNISHVLLILYSLSISNYNTFPFINRPAEELIKTGVCTLTVLKAIHQDQITDLGLQILDLGIDVLLGKLVIEGVIQNCAYDTTLLASILSLDTTHILSLYYKYIDNSENYNSLNTDSMCHNNDFLSLLNFYKTFMKSNLQDPVVCKIKQTDENLIYKLKRRGWITEKQNGSVEIAILKSFYYNIARKKGLYYEHLVNTNKLYPYKSEVDSTYILYYKLYTTNKETYMQICCEVDPRVLCKYVLDTFNTQDTEFFVDIYESVYSKFVLWEE